MGAEKPRPNLNDVARLAEVSAATVSRVLNQTAPVSAAVRERVLAVVSDLGYQASRTSAAFALRRDEAECLRILIGQSVSGIIACGSRLPPDELTTIRRHMDTPMVVINHCVDLPKVGCIMVDLETGVYRAARHLLDLNHTRIAFLPGPAASETSQRRRRGLEAALVEAGLALRPEWCPASFPDVDGGFQAMSAILALSPAQRPTAVITHNDLMALGVLHAIRTHHLHVPEDISVIGIDNIHMAAHANPPLTTLSPPKHRMGRMAMQMLKRLIDGKSAPDPGYTLVECPLIVRESTGLAPGSNGRHASERSGEAV
ncbi:MAG: LacI family transcriptional regulator [Anaerolineae bacterium]|nr:LacI family transcriptional regulator [Anaerolineae bacterium]